MSDDTKKPSDERPTQSTLSLPNKPDGSGAPSNYRPPVRRGDQAQQRRPPPSFDQQNRGESGGERGGYRDRDSAPRRDDRGSDRGNDRGNFSNDRPPRREGGWSNNDNRRGGDGGSRGGFGNDRPPRRDFQPRGEGGYQGGQGGDNRGRSFDRSGGDRFSNDSRPPRRDFGNDNRQGGDRSFSDRSTYPRREGYNAGSDDSRPPRREGGFDNRRGGEDRGGFNERVPPRRDFQPRGEGGYQGGRGDDNRGRSFDRSGGDRFSNDSRPPRRDFGNDNRQGGERSFGDRDRAPYPRREGGFDNRRGGEGGNRGGFSNDRPPRRDFQPRGEGGYQGGENRGRSSFERSGDRFSNDNRQGSGDRDSRPPRRDFGNDNRQGGERSSFGDRDRAPYPRREGGFDNRRSSEGNNRGGFSNDRPPRRDFGSNDNRGGGFSNDRPPRRDFQPRGEGGYGNNDNRNRGFDDSRQRSDNRGYGDSRQSYGDRDSRAPRQDDRSRSFDRRDGSGAPKRYDGRKGFKNKPAEKHPFTPTLNEDGTVRLARMVANMVQCTRREADDLIVNGWVIVDGEVVDELGSRVRPEQKIELSPDADLSQVKRDGSASAEPREPITTEHAEGSLRLSKRMADLGLCSRREADEYIAMGFVSVDGVVINELGSRVLPHQQVTLSEDATVAQSKRVTILLNKPIGYVSGQAEDGYLPAKVLVTQDTHWKDDPVTDELDASKLMGLAPAGRLDIDSTGMLVLTQDGRIAKHLIGQDSVIEKEYLVRVEGELSEEGLALLNHGLSLDDVELKPAKVSWQNEDQLRFVLREGRKRQIRRMCELVGLTVTGLKRVRIGSVPLAGLPAGEWRYLRDDEQF